MALTLYYSTVPEMMVNKDVATANSETGKSGGCGINSAQWATAPVVPASMQSREKAGFGHFIHTLIRINVSRFP